MAKKTLKVKPEEINGRFAGMDFDAIRSQNQVGDRFYVPAANMMLVINDGVPAEDQDGNVLTNEDGSAQRRKVAQRFMAVRVVDNSPVEVMELYVGSLVKFDVERRLAYPGDIANAFRQGSEAIKKAICNKVLEITDEKTIQGRTWDPNKRRWKRDEKGNFVPSDSRALKFEAKPHNMSAENYEKANQMLMEYYEKNYSEFLDDAE